MSSRPLARRAIEAAKSTIGTDQNLVELIHAIKNDIVGRIGDVESAVRSGNLGRSEEVAVLGMQITRLQTLVEESGTDRRSPWPVELAFALQQTGRLESRSRILVVGEGSAPIASTLASLGHRITLVGVEGHIPDPRVEAVESVGDVRGHPFDAILRIGAGTELSPGDPWDSHAGLAAEAVAMSSLRTDRTHPETRLAFTAQYGPHPTARAYDNQRLERILTGWRIDRMSVLKPTGRRWELEAESPLSPEQPDRLILVGAVAQ